MIVHVGALDDVDELRDVEPLEGAGAGEGGDAV